MALKINKTQAGKVWNHFAIVKDAFFLSFRSYFSSSTLSKCWLSVVRQAVEKQLRSGLYSFSSFASYSSLVNVLGVSLYNVYGFFLRFVGCSKHWLLQWLYIYFFQVAQFILDDAIEQGHGSLCRIICTQPRRISAISVCFLSVPHLLIYITLQARFWQ